MALPEGSGFLHTLPVQPDKPVHNLWQFSTALAGYALGTGIAITVRCESSPKRAGKDDHDESKTSSAPFAVRNSEIFLKWARMRGVLSRKSDHL